MQFAVIALKVIQFYIHIVPCSLMLLHSKLFNCIYILFHAVWCYCTQSKFNFIYILFHRVWCYCTQSHSVLYTYCSMQSDVIALKVIQFYIHIVPCSLMLLHSKSFSFIYILFHAVWCYCTQSHSIVYTYCSMQSDVIALNVIQFYIHIVPWSLMLLQSKSFNYIYTYCSMQSDAIALKVIQLYIHIAPCSLMLFHSKSFNFIYILFHAVWCYCTQSHSILCT